VAAGGRADADPEAAPRHGPPFFWKQRGGEGGGEARRRGSAAAYHDRGHDNAAMHAAMASARRQLRTCGPGTPRSAGESLSAGRGGRSVFGDVAVAERWSESRIRRWARPGRARCAFLPAQTRTLPCDPDGPQSGPAPSKHGTHAARWPTRRQPCSSLRPQLLPPSPTLSSALQITARQSARCVCWIGWGRSISAVDCRHPAINLQPWPRPQAVRMASLEQLQAAGSTLARPLDVGRDGRSSLSTACQRRGAPIGRRRRGVEITRWRKRLLRIWDVDGANGQRPYTAALSGEG